jgi:hypothetical protein
MRTLRLTLERKYGVKISPSRLLLRWACRHAAWSLSRFQPKSTGHTAYFSKRGREYTTPTTPFGECVLYKVLAEDKFQARWLQGVYVGRVDQTDEAILLTADCVAKSRSIKRMDETQRYNLTFMNSCRGLPWNPRGTEADEGGVHRGDLLTAGGKMRALYITKALIAKYGRTNGCPACEEFGSQHSAECRQRIEQAMIAAGEATDWGPAASTADASTAAQVPAAAAASSRKGSDLDADVEAAAAAKSSALTLKLARPSEEAFASSLGDQSTQESEKPMQKRARRTDESGEAAMLIALVGISEPPKDRAMERSASVVWQPIPEISPGTRPPQRSYAAV